MLSQKEPIKALSILLVDNDQSFRTWVRTLLDLYSQQGQTFLVVGETSRLETAVSLTAQRHPDLILLDMELLEGDGLAVLKQLQNHSTSTKILALSARQSDSWILAMQAGAAGYMFKSQVPQHLWDAITTVNQGKVFISSEAATAFFQQLKKVQKSAPLPIEQPDEQLSPREKQVLFWLVKRTYNKEISKPIWISLGTVKAHLTNIFLKLKTYQGAEADFTQVIALNPDDADAYYNRGTLRSELKNYQGAEADYNQAIALNPDYAEAYNNRGNLRFELKNYQGAEADYNQAIALNPDYAEAYYNRGILHDELKNYQRAEADYTQAIALNPDDAEAYYNRGILREELKNYQSAIADLQTAAQLFRKQGNMDAYQIAQQLSR